jgi:hypothetical protein
MILNGGREEYIKFHCSPCFNSAPRITFFGGGMGSPPRITQPAPHGKPSNNWGQTRKNVHWEPFARLQISTQAPLELLGRLSDYHYWRQSRKKMLILCVCVCVCGIGNLLLGFK